MRKRTWTGSILGGLFGLLVLNACGDTTATQSAAMTSLAPAVAVSTSATTTVPATSNAATTLTQPNSTPTTIATNATNAPNKTTEAAMAQNTTPAVDSKLAQIAASLPKIRQAPDWDNQNWLNSQPLKLSDLRGQVVLVEFWTFECINCQNVLPAMRQWYDQFNNKGLTIVSFHDPEFSTERDWNNVQQAVKEDNIKYAVAQDNDFKTWNEFRVNAWPTWFLVDKAGNIRYKHIGEGAYDETALNIQALIAEPYTAGS